MHIKFVYISKTIFKKSIQKYKYKLCKNKIDASQSAYEFLKQEKQ